MGPAAIQLVLQYRYFIIFPLVILEGPVVMMATGFLYGLGYFSFVPMFLILVFGDLCGDIIWYSVGYFGGMPFILRFGKYFSISEEGIARVKVIFQRHHSTILFISKITMGLGFALVTLVTAGLTRVPFGRYLIFNIVGGFIWTGFLLAVGYYLGALYLTIGRGFEIVTICALILIVLAGLYGFGNYVRKMFVF